MIKFKMTFITEKNLRANIREVNVTIKAVAVDLGRDIKILHSQFIELESIIENLSEQIAKLSNRITNNNG